MLTRQDIIEKIKEAGGEWIPLHGVVLTSREGEETDPNGVMPIVKINNAKHEFWLMGHYEEGHAFFAQGLHRLDKMSEIFSAAKLLAVAIDYDMPGSDLKIIEKVVTDPSADAKLAGKVEAYEKLLIGRAITITA